MNTKTKKILSSALIVAMVVLLVICSQFVIINAATINSISITGFEKTESNGSADTYTISYFDGTTYQFTVTNVKDGQDGQDAEKVSIQEIYQSYMEQCGETSYADFLANYLQLTTDNSSVINVKVYTEFNVTTNSNYRPFQSTTKSVSVQCGSAVIYKMYSDVTYIITNYHVVFNQSANSDNGGKIAKKNCGLFVW